MTGFVTDDVEARDLYLSYAREGRSALWMHLPEESNVGEVYEVLVA